ncbi:MAG: MexH family multidrug efflux RND transporter periplasmic adaptor subunit [marine bacterium B5-7]|nr:MAG: MexH family multidrug efflux RND transporter periplasmic adaptor subunit [marine bacterium B5-7]
MRLVFRFFLVLVLLVLIFGGIYFLKTKQWQQMAAMQSSPPPPATIAATEVRVDDWRPSIQSIGSLKAINGIAVTTEVAGTVRAFEFESGQQVKTDDVLVQLDDAVDRAALNGLIADQELARTQFVRASELAPRRAISQSEVDETRFRYEGIQARVKEQRARLAKKTIRAPFDGVLGLRIVDIGEYLSPGDDIVQLRTLNPIFVDYSVPEREFSNVSEGQKISLKVPAYPDREFNGTITAIDSGIDEGTRSVRVRATVKNADNALTPGMFAEVNTLSPDLRQVLTVPRTAIAFNTYGDYVFVIKSGEGDALTVSRQQVKVGVVREGRIEVREGLEPGQKVVRAGLVKLREGQNVAIDESVQLDDADISRQ